VLVLQLCDCERRKCKHAEAQSTSFIPLDLEHHSNAPILKLCAGTTRSS
jgi:hypothetical protein